LKSSRSESGQTYLCREIAFEYFHRTLPFSGLHSPSRMSPFIDALPRTAIKLAHITATFRSGWQPLRHGSGFKSRPRHRLPCQKVRPFPCSSRRIKATTLPSLTLPNSLYSMILPWQQLYNISYRNRH